MLKLLNKENIAELATKIQTPLYNVNPAEAQIMHFGVGGFHRSHQAFNVQQLIKLNPELYSKWAIVGVCILPSDQVFIEQLQKQDNLYCLRMSDAKGNQELEIIRSICHVMYAPHEHREVIERIASAATKVISFTITEGGYNIDEFTGKFIIDKPEIQSDLQQEQIATTVFGFLARGLQLRKRNGIGGLTLLSCDNIQENGQVLQRSLGAFLNAYDPDLSEWVDEHIAFPNSMVDRITPVSTLEDKRLLAETHALKDDCLVVSELFFQWVVEKKFAGDFPPLNLVGVEFADDVKPYEVMKLGILNGGHSLIGFLGDALGYNFIHDAVKDPYISSLLDRYVLQEVVPTLTPIEGADFRLYYQQVKNRFANAMIQDSIARIISGSSAKIPKFVNPIIQKQIVGRKKYIIAALLIATWWKYLHECVSKNRIEEIQDNMRETWIDVFRDSRSSSKRFIETYAVFGDLSKHKNFARIYEQFIKLIQADGIKKACEVALNKTLLEKHE